MKFVIADDHALFRSGLVLLLRQIYGEDTKVIETGDFEETLASVKSEGQLDAVLCDLMMPNMLGGDRLPELITAAHGAPVVIVSASHDVEDIKRTLRKGARGYVFKEMSLDVLHGVLDVIFAGGSYAPSEFVKHMTEPGAGEGEGEGEAEAKGEGGQPLERLTDRELEIARALMEGASNKQIARSFQMAEGTVKSHLKSIFRKLEVHNRTEAAMRAARLFKLRGRQDTVSTTRQPNGAPEPLRKDNRPY